MCPFLLSIFLEKLPVSLFLPVDCVPDRPFARHELAFVYYYTSGRSFVCLDSVLICSFVNCLSCDIQFCFQHVNVLFFQ